MRAKTPEAVTWLISAGVSGFALLCLGAFVYEKTRKKVQHPKLGTLVYDWGSWSGMIAHYKPGEVAVRIELPGSKKGPDLEACEGFLRFWEGVEARVADARELAVEEFLEIRDAYDDEPESDSIEQILQASTDEAFEEYWCLVGACSSSDATYRWSLEFEVAWDPEHTRSAYFDSSGELKGYALSCAEPFEEEDE